MGNKKDFEDPLTVSPTKAESLYLFVYACAMAAKPIAPTAAILNVLAPDATLNLLSRMGLTIRDQKGSALLHAEMDANWRYLRDRIDALEALYNLSWESNGTLKQNTVNGSALQDRIVSTNKRTFPSNFWFNAAGTANALTIANPAGLEIAGLASNQGTVFYIKTGSSSNTGPVTLTVDGLTASVMKATGTPLVAGDLPANSVMEFYLDVVAGVPVFLLVRAVPTIAPLISGIDAVQGSVLSTQLPDTAALVKIGTVQLTKPAGSTWKHINLQFSTNLQRDTRSFAGAEWRIGADVLALNMVGNQEIHDQSSDDERGTTIVAHGLPGTHTADDVIAIDLYARQSTDPAYQDAGGGDDPTSRRLAGVGYYGP